MSDWRKKARIQGDVIFFEYVTSRLERNSPLVYVWDIDKTYLDTHFETFKGLLRVAFEKAFQKRNVPGTGALVRALTSQLGEDVPFPIYFISASPPQMEQKIRQKLELDSINPYGAFFKDNLKNLKPKHFRKLSQHVGFKLQALMELRLRLKEDVKQVLWGDDSESDAVIYSLYSDICARRINSMEIRKILESLHVEEPQLETILEIQEQVPNHDPVERIYINLANDTDPDYYEKFGKRLLPTTNTLQAALDLYQEKRLSEDQLLRVAQDMTTNYGFTTDELAQAIDEMVSRKRLTRDTVEKMSEFFRSQNLIPHYYRPASSKLPESLAGQKEEEGVWIPSFVDYFNDFR